MQTAARLLYNDDFLRRCRRLHCFLLRLLLDSDDKFVGPLLLLPRVLSRVLYDALRHLFFDHKALYEVC